jgi:leucine dehydrogenase
VVVADVDATAATRLAEELGVDVADPDAILATECDVVSPCALGGALNDRTIPDLRCRVVCGAANNQLERPEHAAAVAARGIVYAPDYVVNAGGIINISEEFVPGGYDPERARRSVARIEETLTTVFRLAREQNLTPAAAADRMAEDRLRAGREERLEAAAR